MVKAERSSQNIRCRKKKGKKKKNVDILDIPNFLLNIPYGILTPYVSESRETFFNQKIHLALQASGG